MCVLLLISFFSCFFNSSSIKCVRVWIYLQKKWMRNSLFRKEKKIKRRNIRSKNKPRPGQRLMLPKPKIAPVNILILSSTHSQLCTSNKSKDNKLYVYSYKMIITILGIFYLDECDYVFFYLHFHFSSFSLLNFFLNQFNSYIV